MRVDDGLEVFKLHGIGGMVGSFLTGIFAQESSMFISLLAPVESSSVFEFTMLMITLVSMLDGITSASGGLDGNGIQIGKQFAEITAISSYSFVVTAILLYVLNYIPGMKLRISEEAEMMGLDMDQFFEEQIGDWSLFEEVERKRMVVVEGEASGSGSDTPGEVVSSEEGKPGKTD